MQIALAFVFGFTLLYTLAGALIGYVGHTAQLVFAEHSRLVAIVSGVVVIMMGIWVGIRGTRNFVCKIPDQKAMRASDNRDILGSLLVSMGYALGCTACFGGAIVATLIIYVGYRCRRYADVLDWCRNPVSIVCMVFIENGKHAGPAGQQSTHHQFY